MSVCSQCGIEIPINDLLCTACGTLTGVQLRRNNVFNRLMSGLTANSDTIEDIRLYPSALEAIILFIVSSVVITISIAGFDRINQFLVAGKV